MMSEAELHVLKERMYQGKLNKARRGELLVYDKQARPLADRIVLPVPSKLGKGVLISPTVYGNVMLGPTAEDLTDRTDTGSSESGLAFLREKGLPVPRWLEKD